MQKYRALSMAPGVDEAERAWIDRYSAIQTRLDGEEPADAYQRVKKWLKANKPQGCTAEFLKWERAYFAIGNCGKEWIGYRASCCGDKTPSIAVPIGCNHRLCPLCAWHRSQRARVRIKTIFDRLTHPVMITLTVPNPKKISKHTFTMFRQRVRAWIAQWNELCKGGVYSIETTYNRTLKTWHIHAHVLADFSRPLPSKTNKVDFCGARAYAFTALKWRMEYDWLLLTMGKNPAGWVHDGKLFRPKNDPPKKSQKAIRKWKSAWDNYWFNFTRWVEAKREHSTLWAKYKMGGKWLLRPRSDYR